MLEADFCSVEGFLEAADKFVDLKDAVTRRLEFLLFGFGEEICLSVWKVDLVGNGVYKSVELKEFTVENDVEIGGFNVYFHDVFSGLDNVVGFVDDDD